VSLDGLAERIRAAAAAGTALRIRGGGTKDFLAGAPGGEVLDTRGHAGIVAYEPTELYVTARCGTALAELERTLDERGQMLPFEPPHFGDGATVGGMVAAGFSGPRRIQAGAVRDFVLGVGIIDGRGERLRFGGQVMKNVAGYDVSRLMCGSFGTLALVTEVTLKVLPRPVAELTLTFEMPQDRAIMQMNQWAGLPLPVSASAWHDGVLTIRLSGAAAGVTAARRKLGGAPMADVEAREFWQSVREQTHAFFEGTPLWRVAVPSTAELELPGPQFIEWHGGLRWVRGELDAARIHDVATRAGGHARSFRSVNATASPALPPVLARLNERVRAVFDPAGVFAAARG